MIYVYAAEPLPLDPRPCGKNVLLEATYELVHPSLYDAISNADTLCFLLRTPEDAHGEGGSSKPSKKRSRAAASQKAPPRTAYWYLHGVFRMQWPGTDQFYSVHHKEFDPKEEADLVDRCVSGLVRFTPGGSMYELDVADLLEDGVARLCKKLFDDLMNLEVRRMKKSAP